MPAWPAGVGREMDKFDDLVNKKSLEDKQMSTVIGSK
jgi:hypothetical protein